MFAEFECFALAVLLILCGGIEDRLRYEISFDALLEKVSHFILLLAIGFYFCKKSANIEDYLL